MSARPWRVGDWDGLGWTETVLKVGGVGVGIAALLTALGRGDFRVRDLPRAVPIALTAAYATAYLALMLLEL